MPAAQLRLRDVLAKSTTFLEQKKVDSPRLSAELVVAHALEVGRLDLFLDLDKPLGEPELARIRPFLVRRGSGEPMAYILGRKEFYGLDFHVSRDVLIPRPETELGVDLALKLFDRKSPLWFADVGTGSGALAVTLLKHLPEAFGLATDISREALLVAGKNMRRHGVAARAVLARGNLLQHMGQARLDLVIANLPYIGEDEARTISREVLEFEPRSALVGGPRGDELFAPLLIDAARALKPGGYMLLEIGYSQAQWITECIQSLSKHWRQIRIFKDLAGLNRYLQVQWSG